MATKRKASKRISKIANPNVGIDGINRAVRALFAYKGPAFYKDLAAAAAANPVYMSQALSASRDVGLTTLSGGRGSYKLTSEGEEYARLLSFGKESECREMMKKMILQNPLWSEILTFLRVSKGQERGSMDLVLDVERKLGKRWSPTMRSKMGNVYTSILEYAGLVLLEKGKIVSQIGIEEEVVVPPEKPRKEITEKPMEKPTIAVPGEDFAELRIPDSFILYVRKDLSAIDFFEKQVKENSVFADWIEFIKGKVRKTSSRRAAED